ncbi:RraA family protein [Tropicibacter naphthalenivorans]|uniref:Bifunctional hexulose-6-phosphate synthase/ribonuclease regulator n=1 Tax=Tropicibacter naphthalenivorans TaxID=441103 RepID=A0A0P1GJF5_9RHOB|nr:RraA family protein [Tropicibacter naphthalenivorans]CUH81976.1 bifunctional hexulose-6-phosphate synthase/ribonuclease regulator [Tropicibacter naphthalenivorans]SMD07840.1 Regulator of RNase E activity RraA [Tropicibacter naphthalenivorans]
MAGLTDQATRPILDLLRRVDTPTVCNAIEVIDGKRGFDAFTRGRVLASDARGVLVGQARTARISAAQPPTDPPETVRARRMDYYRYMATGEGARLAVVQDIDPQPVGAYWGELNTTVHKGFGLCGALTNGVMRDLGDLCLGFPVLAGGIGPSHAFVHVTEIACPVQVFGLTVAPDDWVHADRHGALVIPKSHLPELPAAIAKMQRTEAIVLDAARAPDFDFARFEAAWTAFEAART